MTEIVMAQSPEEVAAVRELFLDYAQSLGFSLCFQNFDHELATLPGDYAPPRGCLWLLRVDGQAAGCGALHPLAEDICEIKRVYVRPEFRGRRLGRQLMDHAIAAARTLGYTRMRLDTVAEKMQTAVEMYREMGFVEIAPYRENPMASALYMELALTPRRQRATEEK
jgi:ribosomal protein S18 acetylase RimI-like enzyme